MRNIFNFILKPNLLTLTIFGLFSLLVLTFYVWRVSFVWEYFTSMHHYIVELLLVLIVGYIVSRIIDKKFGVQLKKYFLISIIQLLIIWVVSIPISSWQINSSFDKAQLIIDSLEHYKEKYDSYPSTLDELSQTLNKGLPTRTNIGTYYIYEEGEDNDFRISFLSYHGYTAYYNNETKKWLLHD